MSRTDHKPYKKPLHCSYDVGLIQWNHKLQCLISLKYPILRSTRASLAALYYHLTLIPGLDTRIVDVCASMAITLLTPKRKISNRDLTLPWKPLYDLLYAQLFPKARTIGLTAIANTLLDLAIAAQRFYSPLDADDMLDEILPQIDGSSVNSVIAGQAFLVHFLPLSKPQRWLPAMFKLWSTFESSLFDDQMIDLLARLSEMHCDPAISAESSSPSPSLEPGAAESAASVPAGLWKDVGLLTKDQFSLVMTKALRAAGLPVGANKHANATLMAQSISMRSGPDAAVSDTIMRMKKPSRPVTNMAVIMIYNMSCDGPVAPPEGEATPSPPKGVGGTSNEQNVFLAGSRALDAVARFLQATETYFHPSNWGPWQFALAGFVGELSAIFLNRWRDEQRSDCKTPLDRRLTPEIKREFVNTSKTVCLLSMFGKDGLTIAASQKALKRLAILEPDLIIPAVLDRAYSSLEELETTHRTTAIITMLSALSLPLVSREIFPAGGKHLAPLLHLCLPAFDPTDASKTMCACSFVVTALMTIRLDDLTRPELTDSAVDDADVPNGESEEAAAARATRKEEDDALRMSTGDFVEWSIEYFNRVFVICAALPEEGATGKVGGKQEEQVIGSLLASTDSVVVAMSPHLRTIAFNHVLKYCAENTSPSATRVIGSIIACFARVDPELTLSKVFPLVDARIREELQHGASSARTISGNTTAPGDAALHWHIAILIGAISSTGKAVLKYREGLLSLCGLLIERTRSVKGYTMSAGLVNRLITVLCTFYPSDWHCLNPDEWNDPQVARNSHMHWGKLYEAREAQLRWHIPDEEDVAFAIEVLQKLVEPRMNEFLELQSVAHELRDTVWSNDFIRKLSLLKYSFTAQASLVPDARVGGGELASDAGNECMEFIRPPPAFKSGFVLQDPESPHYKYVVGFRERLGDLLYRSATSTKASEAEDKQGCIRLLLRTVRTYLSDYSYSSEEYNNQSQALSFYRKIFKVYPRQKEQPRMLWIRRAAFYHASRGRLNAFHRRRTALDDKLIKDVVLEYCMSTYVGIRKTAQNTLDHIAGLYDGTRQICMPILLKAVAPGVGDDRMKGALYCLGSKGFGNLAIVDARFTSNYITCLINAQHHPKPSLQKVVRALLGDFCARFAEPSTFKFRIEPPQELVSVVRTIERSLASSTPSTPVHVLEEVVAKRQSRSDEIDGLQAKLNPVLLKIARDPHVHWSFAQFAARILRALIRRDQPINPEVASYFVQELISDNPNLRKYATGALTRLLYFIKLRTLCASDQDLTVGKSSNPLKLKETLPVPMTREYENELFASLVVPMDAGEGESSHRAKYRDRSHPGWLVWGKQETYYAMPPKDQAPWQWDESSKAAVDAMWSSGLGSDEYWSKLFSILGQEKPRTYPATENFGLIKSFAQIYGYRIQAIIAPIAGRAIDLQDRHAHRAASEAVVGVIKGSKHWPLDDQDKFWTWIVPLFPRIFKESTQDSQPAWSEMVHQAFEVRDPRRSQPLFDFTVQRAKEYQEGKGEFESLNEQKRAHSMFRSLIALLDRKLIARAPEFVELYSRDLGSAFGELRSEQSEILADLDLFSVAPRYPSVEHFLRDASGSEDGVPLSDMPDVYKARFEMIKASLEESRPSRVPLSQGTSRYDCISMTSLLWISTTLGDHRHSKMEFHAIEFLPHIFQMLELKDNPELSNLARAALTKICTHHFGPGDLPGKLVKQLLTLLNESKESWRVRLDALPILQVAYFQNLFYLGPADIRGMVDVLLALLKDAHPEVREMVATSLSGIVRCSERKLIADLKRRFTHTVTSTVLPARGSEGYSSALVELHSGILGATALLSAFPYEVPSWMPELLLQTVCQHTDDPPPVSTTIKKCAREWKRTHQDGWEEASKAFTPEELAEVNAWALGRSDYYA